jgi:hypothetical protein
MRVALIQDSTDINPVFPIPVDIVVLSNNFQIKLKELMQSYRFKKIVVDSSFNLHSAGKLMKEADLSGVDLYSVLHKGAFVYDMHRK